MSATQSPIPNLILVQAHTLLVFHSLKKLVLDTYITTRRFSATQDQFSLDQLPQDQFLCTILAKSTGHEINFGSHIMINSFVDGTFSVCPSIFYQVFTIQI